MFDGSWGTNYVPKEYPWEEWFAWHPVRVHGKRRWLTKVYRKQIRVYGVLKEQPPRYEYGNLFDVIKGD